MVEFYIYLIFSIACRKFWERSSFMVLRTEKKKLMSYSYLMCVGYLKDNIPQKQKCSKRLVYEISSDLLKSCKHCIHRQKVKLPWNTRDPVSVVTLKIHIKNIVFLSFNLDLAYGRLW